MISSFQTDCQRTNSIRQLKIRFKLIFWRRKLFYYICVHSVEQHRSVFWAAVGSPRVNLLAKLNIPSSVPFAGVHMCLFSGVQAPHLRFTCTEWPWLARICRRPSSGWGRSLKRCLSFVATTLSTSSSEYERNCGWARSSSTNRRPSVRIRVVIAAVTFPQWTFSLVLTSFPSRLHWNTFTVCRHVVKLRKPLLVLWMTEKESPWHF